MIKYHDNNGNKHQFKRDMDKFFNPKMEENHENND